MKYFIFCSSILKNQKTKITCTKKIDPVISFQELSKVYVNRQEKLSNGSFRHLHSKFFCIILQRNVASHIVELSEIYSQHFLHNFRVCCFSRNILQVRVKLSFFHNVHLRLRHFVVFFSYLVNLHYFESLLRVFSSTRGSGRVPW